MRDFTFFDFVIFFADFAAFPAAFAANFASSLAALAAFALFASHALTACARSTAFSTVDTGDESADFVERLVGLGVAAVDVGGVFCLRGDVNATPSVAVTAADVDGGENFRATSSGGALRF